VVILCEKREEPFLTDSVLRKRISGILMSEATSAQLVAGLRAAEAGLQVSQNFLNNHQRLSETMVLTPRELEILTLVADGEGNKTIADVLKISKHTVKFQLSSIFEKLRVSTQTEAVKSAIPRGLISI